MKPRVLVVADVPDWAWGRKARALQAHLKDRFDVEVLYETEPGAGQVIAAGRHDLVHTFEVSQVGRMPQGLRLVTGLTAHVIEGYERRHGKGIVRTWAERAVGVHANSRLLQAEAEAHLGRPVYYCPNGVDEAFWCRYRPRTADLAAGGWTVERDPAGRDPAFWARCRRRADPAEVAWARFTPGSTGFVVGHVAKRNPRKGQEIVRDACASAGVELRQVDLKAHAALSAEALRDFYQDLHVLAVSSDMDGTPNPALEAAACEVAVVGNPIGNLPEFVDGDNGRLTERTVESLAATLRALAARPGAEVEAMGRAARDTILRDWTWNVQAEAYAAMWGACLGRPAR